MQNIFSILVIVSWCHILQAETSDHIGGTETQHHSGHGRCSGLGDMGYNGHPFVETPEMDAMTRAGLVLDRFYAAAPVCSPTRASVMTGRNPIRCEVTNHGRYMRPHEQTIAESLKEAGYVTGIFGKVPTNESGCFACCRKPKTGISSLLPIPERSC